MEILDNELVCSIHLYMRAKILSFTATSITAILLSGCSKLKAPLSSTLTMTVVENGEKISSEITGDQITSLPKATKMLSFEANGEEKETTIVYLKDALDKLQPVGENDLLLTNCSDNYQSIFTQEVIESARPYFVLEVEGQALNGWLTSIEHPEWGPHIINIENPEGLLDPSHKNPWGLVELVVVKKEDALAGWADHDMGEPAQRGLNLYLDSCASCHHTGNGILGGKKSTRPLKLLSIFAVSNEAYFRGMLKDPQKTNPLAQTMPSYAHWSEKNVKDLIEFLKSTVK
jgi:mono/diheme cytochrome c family protein